MGGFEEVRFFGLCMGWLCGLYVGMFAMDGLFTCFYGIIASYFVVDHCGLI